MNGEHKNVCIENQLPAACFLHQITTNGSQNYENVTFFYVQISHKHSSFSAQPHSNSL
jgi:hypothetical protein